MKRAWAFALSITLALTAGCSAPKVKLSGAELPHKAALLPIAATGALREERRIYLEELLRSALQAKGYVLLSEMIRTCSSAECRSDLVRDYNIPAFFELRISKLSKNNFVIGFADLIEGELQLRSAKQSELFSATHLESAAGGLVLESGLAIQGIRSQIENYGDNGFRKLARRFVEGLVAQLPGPAAPVEDADHVEIREITTKSRGGAFFEVCADGTPKLLAHLAVEKRLSTMREVSPGKYCGVFPLTGASPAVELKTPFGTTASKAVPVATSSSCDPSSIAAKLTQSNWQISLSKDCSAALVYRAPMPLGPYSQVGSIKNGSWIDTRPLKEAYYQVVLLSSLGEPLPPITPVVEARVE